MRVVYNRHGQEKETIECDSWSSLLYKLGYDFKGLQEALQETECPVWDCNWEQGQFCKECEIQRAFYLAAMELKDSSGNCGDIIVLNTEDKNYSNYFTINRDTIPSNVDLTEESIAKAIISCECFKEDFETFVFDMNLTNQ